MKELRNLVITLFVLIMIASGYYLYIGFVEKQEPQITSTGVLERVRSISELNTVEMYFSEIIDYKDARYFHDIVIPFTEKSFIFTAKARIKAGLDLSDLAEKDFVIEGKKLLIRLPKPTITTVEILEHKAFDEKDGLFNEVRNEDTFKALDTFRDTVSKEAEEMGILDKAEENTTALLETLLAPLGFEEIGITYE